MKSILFGVRGRRAALLSLVGSSLALSGCIETVVHPPSPPRPHPDRSPTYVEESKLGEPQSAMRVDNDEVLVETTQSQLCRTNSMQPAVRDQVVERELTGGGWVGQTVLLGGAAAGGVAGGYLLSNPCTMAEATGVPCIDETQSVNKGVGIGALVVGGIMLAAFTGNALSTIDGSRELEADPIVGSHTDWQVCGLSPVAGAPVEIRFASGHVATGKTGGDGIARVSLSSIPPTPWVLAEPRAQVHVGGSLAGIVNLRTTDLYRRAELAAPPRDGDEDSTTTAIAAVTPAASDVPPSEPVTDSASGELNWLEKLQQDNPTVVSQTPAKAMAGAAADMTTQSPER